MYILLGEQVFLKFSKAMSILSVKETRIGNTYSVIANNSSVIANIYSGKTLETVTQASLYAIDAY